MDFPKIEPWLEAREVVVVKDDNDEADQGEKEYSTVASGSPNGRSSDE